MRRFFNHPRKQNQRTISSKLNQNVIKTQQKESTPVIQSNPVVDNSSKADAVAKAKADAVAKAKADAVAKAKADAVAKAKADTVAKAKTDEVVKAKTDAVVKAKADVQNKDKSQDLERELHELKMKYDILKSQLKSIVNNL